MSKELNNVNGISTGVPTVAQWLTNPTKEI